MPTPYTTTSYIYLEATESGGTLTWTNATPQGTLISAIVDDNDDGNLDISADFWHSAGHLFTGYTYTAPNGSVYPIFGPGPTYVVAYGPDYDLWNSGGGFPTTGSTSDYSDNAVTWLCFAANTSISTPDGSMLVESLSIGDLITTQEGRAVVVKWIGRQTVMTRFGPAERLMLVRFAAGSLGSGLPHEPLTVTADHGMLVEGVICHAGALVNGKTITRVPLAKIDERYTVYHIETEAHEIILANGAPAETFIDNVSRRVFDNFAEFETRYGDVPEMQELPYPRAMSVRQVPERIRTMLARVTAA